MSNYHRYQPHRRIQAPPPLPVVSSPSSVYIPPSFVPLRQFFPQFNGTVRHSHLQNPKYQYPTAPPFKQFIENTFYGLPTAYGLPGELDFGYPKSVGKQQHYKQFDFNYDVPQRTWRDINICQDNDVSTNFAQSNTLPELPELEDFQHHRYSLPTDETFVSEYESDHDDSDSSSYTRDNRHNSGSNWRNTSNQYDSDATSSDETEDDDSDYYESDSEDEWSFPPRFGNYPLPTGLTLKEAVLSYEQRWNALLTQRGGNQLIFGTVPWPQYPPPQSPADINFRSIREFLRAAGGPSIFMLKTIFRQTMLRFHPDKSAVLLAHVEEGQRRLVFEGCTAVTRCLNDIKDIF
ncbi:hypothetical protein Clacol_001002 [Clathrus columnatus]|uniref:Uncharacterized protein n=1 Tax=Clathrus columnatus TaxID=1419009 RepID=A0AAV5A1B3_9AGAM|nr:hypothetical protein Clacol_001002 [Clathrus columnatus]